MRLFLAVCVVSVVACSPSPTYLPDGGRVRLSCSDSVLKVPVTVLDRLSQPAAGASVMAVNLSDGRRMEGLTDDNGVFVVTDDLAPGVIKVTATLNDLTASEKAITFTCGSCDCSSTPNALTLPLQ